MPTLRQALHPALPTVQYPKGCTDDIRSHREGYKYFRAVNTARWSNTKETRGHRSHEGWEEVRKEGKVKTRYIAHPSFTIYSFLASSQRGLCCDSLQAAAGSQPRAGPGPHCGAQGYAERKRLPGTPFLGPVGHQWLPASGGTKTLQYKGRLQYRLESQRSHRRQGRLSVWSLQDLGTPWLHRCSLLLPEADPGCRLFSLSWRSKCSPLTPSPVSIPQPE